MKVMVRCSRWTVLALLLLFVLRARAADARFDLVGPRIDLRVTRGSSTLPIASVPNLQPGDKLWIHPDLPPTQSVHYLLICVFLRGTTNPPPDAWFTRINTWDRKVREEGTFLTVPDEAQQAVLFMAPETGGDFTTLKSAVKGRPGIFVRASQDLAEAGFEQARIEKYLASIRQVPPSNSADLQKHSDLLARTLALKPNEACFKQPVDTQFTCLTQTGTQALLDDGHGQTIVAALSTGQNSDFINAASYTRLAGAGEYSAYVGAIIDLVRIMGNLHTAQYQYIPAIAFPQGESLNLRLNTPPSFHNPKSVLVIGLPAIQKAAPPPLRSADADNIACLLKPSVVLPIEGAPLVFSTAFAHDLVLHLNTPPGIPAKPDIPLAADAYQGGLVLQRTAPQHVPLHDPASTPKLLSSTNARAFPHPDLRPPGPAKAIETPFAPAPAPEPVLLTGVIQGAWGFDPFTGPSVQLQQLPGAGWHIVPPSAVPSSGAPELIAGHAAQLVVASTGTACVHTITAQPSDAPQPLSVTFKPEAGGPAPAALTLSLPLEHAVKPGDLHLEIQQYGQPEPDRLAARTFVEAAHVSTVEMHAGDRVVRLAGTDLAQVASVRLGDLLFDRPVPENPGSPDARSLQLGLPADAPTPSLQGRERLSAIISLQDGRTLTRSVQVDAPRPALMLLRKSSEPLPAPTIALGNAEVVPLSQRLTFTVKSAEPFPRSGQIEVATLDGTLRAVLTLAPSGGLVLQDPRTVVATLDPLRSFGPSAFGPLHLRAVFPDAPAARAHRDPAPTQQLQGESNEEDVAGTVTNTPAELPMSDWLPLATLVRLPTLTQLSCPPEPEQACTLSGANLFLIHSIAADAQFSRPDLVPDGFTGTTLQVPHAAAGTLFLKLRDDPTAVDTAVVAGTSPSLPVTSGMVSSRKPTKH